MCETAPSFSSSATPVVGYKADNSGTCIRVLPFGGVCNSRLRLQDKHNELAGTESRGGWKPPRDEATCGVAASSPPRRFATKLMLQCT